MADGLKGFLARLSTDDPEDKWTPIVGHVCDFIVPCGYTQLVRHGTRTIGC